MKRSERGQALLEVALIVPVLAALVLGIVEVGRMAQIAIEVHDAANAAVTYGSRSLATASDTEGITLAAQKDTDLGTNLVLDPAPTVAFSGTGCSGSPFSSTTAAPYLMVNTSYTAKFLFSSRTMNFTGCAIQRVAY